MVDIFSAEIELKKALQELDCLNHVVCPKRPTYSELLIKCEQQQELLKLSGEISNAAFQIAGGHGLYGNSNAINVDCLSEAIGFLRKAVEKYDDKIMELGKANKEEEND